MRKDLKTFRKSLGVTQEEFAKILNVSRNHYTNVENGKRKGNTELWFNLQEKFNMDAKQVLNFIKMK